MSHRFSPEHPPKFGFAIVEAACAAAVNLKAKAVSVVTIGEAPAPTLSLSPFTLTSLLVPYACIELPSRSLPRAFYVQETTPLSCVGGDVQGTHCETLSADVWYVPEIS